MKLNFLSNQNKGGQFYSSRLLAWVTGTLKTFENFSIIHIFEPVPTFNKILSERWDDHKITNGWDATINNFGLGLNDRLEMFLEQAWP